MDEDAVGGSLVEDPTMSNLLEHDEAKPDVLTPSIDDIKSALYSHCVAQPPDTVFSQADLLATQMIPNNALMTLQLAASALTKSGKFQLMQRGGAACWRCISPTVTVALEGLDPDANVVYAYIRSSGRDGMWTGHLKSRTNLPKTVMDKVLKSLEQKRLIKTVPNYKHPARKTYMLSGLQPAEDLIGGPFFADGELDEEFVRQISFWIDRWIVAKSWWFPSEKWHGKKRRHADREMSEGPVSIEDAEASGAMEVERLALTEDHGRQRTKHMRPFPPNYKKYPSISDITTAVNKSKISKTTMKISDAQTLVDILVWDGRLQKLRKHSKESGIKYIYRAVRSPLAEQDGPDMGEVTKPTGLNEAPCGRCPVFDICEDGGPVSARNCPYFQKWLGLEL
ncbi:uncharacterized protein KY384_001495 [Bacidia gigantensis]|uniref:uncharacterized protein n=1 Tax=Bacidia gigantensis TaxID=2732470 RepID=UPI001D0580B9|nr:uncharacterized protein KY384_001495 [Bacidia gigantensis]KAG8533754.1 hypothetical protein KY384_001495 [Bacidia gigantensis]